MGHPNADLFNIVMGRSVHNGIEQRNDGFTTLEGKSLLPDVLGVQEGFESFCLVEFAQDTQLLFPRHSFVRDLDAFLNPVPLLWVLDVHVFDTHGAAVGITQHAQDVS